MGSISFADFCAGIGGFRLGLERLGWTCVYSCEIDPYCEQTYKLNFGCEFDAKDISEVKADALPYFDVFCAGFPCQPFSIAGKRLGLLDPRGTIFGEIVRIVQHVRPKAVMLENVTHLLHHNGGRTFGFMVRLLSQLGYHVYYEVLDSAYFGVPQSRPRLYILAVRCDLGAGLLTITSSRTRRTPFRPFIKHGDFSIPISARWQEYIDLYTGKKSLREMSFAVPKTRVRLERVADNVDLEDCVLQMRSSGIRAVSIDAPLPTFAVSVSGGGPMIPIYTGERRHLSLTEMKRLMGFPDSYKFDVARTYAIKQLANAVCPQVIASLGEDLMRSLG